MGESVQHLLPGLVAKMKSLLDSDPFVETPEEALARLLADELARQGLIAGGEGLEHINLRAGPVNLIGIARHLLT
jgi:hypothetical protein